MFWDFFNKTFGKKYEWNFDKIREEFEGDYPGLFTELQDEFRSGYVCCEDVTSKIEQRIEYMKETQEAYTKGIEILEKFKNENFVKIVNMR